MSPVKSKCIRAAERLREAFQDLERSVAGDPENPFVTASKFFFRRSDDFLRSLGPAGEELASRVTSTVRRAQRRSATQAQQVRDAVKGFSRQERIDAMLFVNGRRTADEVSAKAREAAEKIRTILDRDLKAAQLLDFQRRVGAARLDIRGSGKPFPQRPNRAGRKVIDEIRTQGNQSARVRAVADRMVEEGRFDTVEEALEELGRFRNDDLRGTNRYFESDRIELPEDLVVWDPLEVLPGQLEKNALTLEGVREFGLNHEDMDRIIGRIEREFSTGIANLVKQSMQLGFGVQGIVPEFSQQILGALGNYQTVSKLSGLFSPLLNFGQRFTNTAFMPLSAQVRALREVPPVFRRWMTESQNLIREIERSGAIRVDNPLIELTDAAPLSSIARKAITPFLAVARGNEIKSALVARFALEADIEKLVELRADNGKFKRMFESIRSLSVDPEGAVRRRIKKSGLDMTPDEAADLVMRGGQLSEAQFAGVMQTAVEDTQFALNLMTQPVWWQQMPALRLMWKFKNFGVRQTGFVWERVFKEAVYGNFAPMVKFAAAATIFGELTNFTRDAVTGSDRSITSLVTRRSADQLTTEEVAVRAFGAFLQQGGIGMMADLTFGVTDWIGGPMAGTTRNLLRLAQDGAHGVMNLDPDQIGLALREFGTRDVVLPRQVNQTFNQIASVFEEERVDRTDYFRFRQEGFRFVRDQEAGGLPGRVGQEVIRAFSGRPNFPRTERTLRFQYARQAVTNGDLDQAEEYMTELLGQAKDREEFGRILDGLRGSAASGSPLGAVPGRLERDFLTQLTPERRERLLELERRWLRNFNTAIRNAVQATR